MKNLLYKKLHKYLFLLISSCVFCQENIIIAQEKKIHSLPIEKGLNQAEKASKKFIPMPAGDINTSSSKVNFYRNPFQEALKTEFPTIENLYSSLRFKGLLKSNNKLFAIIETDNSQKLYEVGDTLENGFIINFISLENVSVDIYNGARKYRLTLSDIENLI